MTIISLVDSFHESGLSLAVVGSVLSSIEDGICLVEGSSQLLLPVGSLRGHGDEIYATKEVFAVGLGGGELQHVVAGLVNGEVGYGTSDAGYGDVLCAIHVRHSKHVVEAGIDVAFEVFEGEVVLRSVVGIDSIGITIEVLPSTHADGDLVLASFELERNALGHLGIDGAVLQDPVLHLLTKGKCTKCVSTVHGTPVDGSTVKIAAVARHRTAAAATEIATPVVVPDLAVVGETILVDGAVVVSNPTHGEGAVGRFSEGLVGAVDNLGDGGVFVLAKSEGDHLIALALYLVVVSYAGEGKGIFAFGKVGDGDVDGLAVLAERHGAGEVDVHTILGKCS